MIVRSFMLPALLGEILSEAVNWVEPLICCTV